MPVEKNLSFNLPGTRAKLSRRNDNACVLRIGHQSSKALVERQMEYTSTTSNNATGVWMLAGVAEGDTGLAKRRYEAWKNNVYNGGCDEPQA